MKFYITKYALTKGIVEVDSDNVRDLKVKEARLYFFDGQSWLHSYSPGEWYADKSDAIVDAEYRKKKRIASLQKQIAKLESMKFEM